MSQTQNKPQWLYTTVVGRNGLSVKCPHCGSLWACNRNEVGRFRFCPACGKHAEQPKV